MMDFRKTPDRWLSDDAYQKVHAIGELTEAWAGTEAHDLEQAQQRSDAMARLLFVTGCEPDRVLMGIWSMMVWVDGADIRQLAHLLEVLSHAGLTTWDIDKQDVNSAARRTGRPRRRWRVKVWLDKRPNYDNDGYSHNTAGVIGATA